MVSEITLIAGGPLRHALHNLQPLAEWDELHDLAVDLGHESVGVIVSACNREVRLAVHDECLAHPAAAAGVGGRACSTGSAASAGRTRCNTASSTQLWSWRKHVEYGGITAGHVRPRSASAQDPKDAAESVTRIAPRSFASVLASFGNEEKMFDRCEVHLDPGSRTCRYVDLSENRSDSEPVQRYGGNAL